MKTILMIMECTVQLLENIATTMTEWFIDLMKLVAGVVILIGVAVTLPIWLIPYMIWRNHNEHDILEEDEL